MQRSFSLIRSPKVSSRSHDSETSRAASLQLRQLPANQLKNALIIKNICRFLNSRNLNEILTNGKGILPRRYLKALHGLFAQFAY